MHPDYKKHFEGKTVLCNCDDPEWSNFFTFFRKQFNHLKLKKLITIHYNADGSPSYKLEWRGDILPQTQSELPLGLIRTELKSNGDFRSEECIEILKEADIVVTNPPFSLFREYVAQLMQYGKGFIIIGNMNAIAYKEIFPLLKSNRMWLGYSSPKEFLQPDKSIKKFGNVLWYTNLDIDKRHEPLFLCKNYHGNESRYPKYDNYDAINVDKVSDIPKDYFECIGVPITFLDKYDPEQFEIINANNIRNDKVWVRGKTATDSLPQNSQVEREREREVLAPGSDGWHINKQRKYARMFVRRRTLD